MEQTNSEVFGVLILKGKTRSSGVPVLSIN